MPPMIKRAIAYLSVILAIFARDVKRVMRNPVALVIVLGMIAMPSAYAWYVVVANWDPYSNTAAMKVAVANEDTGCDSPEAGRLDVGRSVVDAIVAERKAGGLFRTMDEFVERMTNKEVNRRTLENFIKSGALDSLPGNRRQKMMVAPDMLEQKNKEKKHAMEGQMSLFDFVGEEEKKHFQITFPQVEEYGKEELLAFEKEILGIYISGHPMEEYEEIWRSNVTAVTTDFMVDEETETARVQDNQRVTIGGMITGKVTKITKTSQMMAFITVEDLVGSVEVLVFPKDYEKNRDILIEESKVFVSGRVSVGDDPVGKLICERIIPFDMLPKQLWLQFADKAAYDQMIGAVTECLKVSEGSDQVIIWLSKERAKKVLPASWNVTCGGMILEELTKILGEKNVRVVQKGLKV